MSRNLMLALVAVIVVVLLVIGYLLYRRGDLHWEGFAVGDVPGVTLADSVGPLNSPTYASPVGCSSSVQDRCNSACHLLMGTRNHSACVENCVAGRPVQS